jgi:argininosuccinate lyase
MSDFLWQSGKGNEVPELGDAIMQFMAAEDVLLDRVLFPHDLRATAAHVRGLHRIGILTLQDSDGLCRLLAELEADFSAGRFILDHRFEDGHSAIEAYLSERSGDLGARVHTGRSRNDQVAVALRLYMREQVRRMAGFDRAIAKACLEQAGKHENLPMPGYTHLQRAVPSSVGLWLASFAEAFGDDLAFAISVLEILDASPLGTAAGFGVNLPLDRAGVAAELGFSRLHINPMAVQNARGKFELMSLQAAQHAMQDVRRLAWDLSLFATAEFGFVRLPPHYSTGSSIMPNKSNPDVVELLRARVATVEGAIVEIQSVLGLPSGYHRDLQSSKAPLVRGMQCTLQALAIVPALIQGLAFNSERMRDAISPDMFATDHALELAAAGKPFREAYHKVKVELDSLPQRDIEENLARRISPGACGNLQLEEIESRLEILWSRLPEEREECE